MTLEAYRASLFEAIEVAKAGFTDHPVVIRYPNLAARVNVSQLPHPFLDVELIYNTARQADLSNRPWHRLVGFLVLTAKDREDRGTAAMNKLLEHFYPQLHRRVIGSVQLEMADLKTPKPINGIASISAMLPFTINKMY